MDRPQYEPLAEIEVDAARPEPRASRSPGRAPITRNTSSTCGSKCRSTRVPDGAGELLSHSDLTISRRAPEGSPRRCVSVVTALRNDSSARNRQNP